MCIRDSLDLLQSLLHVGALLRDELVDDGAHGAHVDVRAHRPVELGGGELREGLAARLLLTLVRMPRASVGVQLLRIMVKTLSTCYV